MKEIDLTKTLDLDNVRFTNNNGVVDVNIKIPAPKNLYKYYSLNKNSISGLENSTIFFSQANLLNDILEGNFELLWDFEKFKKSNLKQEHKTDIIENISIYKKEFLRWRGVFSMTNNLKNELLWIHYTNESGFCLEFDSDELISFFNLNNNINQDFYFPISYPKKIKQVDFNELYFNNEVTGFIDIKLAILNCFAVKENHWDYEKEWRLMLNREKFNYFSEPTLILDDKTKEEEIDKLKGGNIEIDRKIISKIILAPLFFNNSRFNKHEKIIDKFEYEIFIFKNSEDGKLAKQLLINLKKHYFDKIYQIDKIVVDKEICRDIRFKIDIIDIGDSFVKIKRQNLLK